METGPRLIVSFGRLGKVWVEPATTGMTAAHNVVCKNHIVESLHVAMARDDVGLRSAYLALPAIN